MGIFSQIIISILLCTGVFLFIICLSRATVNPRKRGERVISIVCSKGDSETLEHTVRALLRARDGYGLKMDIVISDSGLAGDCAKIAKLLEKDYDEVCVCSHETLENILKKL